MPTLLSFLQHDAQRLLAEGHTASAAHLCATRASLDHFLNHHDLPLASIPAQLPADYEGWLRSSRCVARNTSSFYLRQLRAALVRAAEQGFCPDPRPRFNTTYTGTDRTPKRAITTAQLRLLCRLTLPLHSPEALARDCFVLSFLTRGMAFVDLALLTSRNLHGSTLHYARSKTGQQLSIEWLPEMSQIVQRHHVHGTPYLLPLLHADTSAQPSAPSALPPNIYTALCSRLRFVNRHLARLAPQAHIEAPLTMYVARHTWASLAHEQGISLALISQCMGHSSLRTTQIYLRQLTAAHLDQANRQVLESVFG